MRHRLLALIVVALAVPAGADLDVVVRGGDRIRGTVFPADEVETFRIDLPQGARLRASVKPKATKDRRFPPGLALRLLDPRGIDVSAGVVDRRGRKARVKGFVAPADGRYALEIRGDGFDVGDYILTVRWSAARRVRRKGVAVTGDAVVGAQVAAGIDATLKIRARAKGKRNAVVPHVVDVLDAGGATVRPFSPPNPAGPKHAVEAVVRDTGTFDVRVRDAVGGSGTVDVDVRVKPSRPARRDVRLTDDVVPAPPADVTVYSTTLLDERGGASAPDGARVEIPAGALARLTPVQIGTGSTFDGPPGTGLLPAGAPVYLGPDPLEFGRLVDVVVPYDAAAFPDGTSELRIVRRDAAGLRTALDAGDVVVDPATRTASVPVGVSGTYGAFRLVPPPAPTSVTPFVGGVDGGYAVTLGGSGFRDLRDPATDESLLEILLDGQPVDVEITDVTPTLVTFTAPPHAAGRVTFAVRDPETGLTGTLPTNTFEYR